MDELYEKSFRRKDEYWRDVFRRSLELVEEAREKCRAVSDCDDIEEQGQRITGILAELDGELTKMLDRASAFDHIPQPREQRASPEMRAELHRDIVRPVWEDALDSICGGMKAVLREDAKHEKSDCPVLREDTKHDWENSWTRVLNVAVRDVGNSLVEFGSLIGLTDDEVAKRRSLRHGAFSIDFRARDREQVSQKELLRNWRNIK